MRWRHRECDEDIVNAMEKSRLTTPAENRRYRGSGRQNRRQRRDIAAVTESRETTPVGSTKIGK